ncbi:MAG: PEGA domain-containing protein [Phycisphaerales bacterium]|nr:PEGA domain-containing protein [Phycisphaerales bacterium]
MRFCFFVVLTYVSLFGCVKRTISITTQPQGALVWVNEREVGRTPVDFDFLYYGEYDVRIEGEGQEPIMTSRWADRPLWDAPIIDLFAEMVPFRFESKTFWHFDFEERNDDQELLVQRAKNLSASVVPDEVE